MGNKSRMVVQIEADMIRSIIVSNTESFIEQKRGNVRLKAEIIRF